MKKKVVLSLLIIVSQQFLFSQIASHDAIALRKLIKYGQENLNPQNDTTFQILYHYVPPSVSGKPQQVVPLFNQPNSGKDPNPFIEITTTGLESAKQDISAVKGISVASIGGMNVTNFADGLAKFMVERFKEELSIAFFDRFKTDLNKEEYSDLRILFPQTNKLLNTIDNNIYQYNIYINSLRESFRNDLSNLYVQLDELTNQPKYKNYLQKNPELRTILSNSSYLINQYAKGIHPGTAFENFNPDLRLFFADTAVQMNSRSAIKAMQLFSSALRSKSKDHYWIGSDSLMLLAEPLTFKIFLGLIYQNKKTDEISFGKSNAPVSLKTILDSVAANDSAIDVYRSYIETFISQSEEVDEYITEMKSKKKSEIDYNDYYKLFSASLDLFDHAYRFVDLPYINLAIKSSIREKIILQSKCFLFVARTSGELFIDVRTQNYSSAIINSVSIIDTVLGYNKTSYLNSLTTSLTALSDKFDNETTKNVSKSENRSLKTFIDDYAYKYPGQSLDRSSELASLKGIDKKIIEAAQEIIQLKRNIATAASNAKMREALLKYGSFMAAIVNAQNSDDVKNAIESVALPAGSYVIKRETNFNVSINSFVGPYGGMEYMPALKANQWAPSTGFTAPVGVAFSWGNINNGNRWKTPTNRKRKNGNNIGGQSLGLFFSIIDIGAIASYRLSNDSTAIASEIQLKNIISPGAYFYWGLPKVPISIGIGAQVGPQLRKVTATTVDLNQNYYVRWGLNLVVDIPFYNLYTKN